MYKFHMICLDIIIVCIGAYVVSYRFILRYIPLQLHYLTAGYFVYYITHYIYIYIYILSGPWKRWGSFQIVSIGRTPAQRKGNGNVDGNVTETFTETQWKR